jgi:hypothetical protein
VGQFLSVQRAVCRRGEAALQELLIVAKGIQVSIESPASAKKERTKCGLFRNRMIARASSRRSCGRF